MNAKSNKSMTAPGPVFGSMVKAPGFFWITSLALDARSVGPVT